MEGQEGGRRRTRGKGEGDRGATWKGEVHNTWHKCAKKQLYSEMPDVQKSLLWNMTYRQDA